MTALEKDPPFRFPIDFAYEVVWRHGSIEEAKKNCHVGWRHSPVTGKLAYLSLGFIFPVGVTVDFEKRQVILYRGPANLPLGSHLLSGIANMLSGLFWSMSGRVALHANGVSLDKEHIIGFTGTSGRGKSTLTAYLIGQGAQFVSDDLLAINPDRSVIPIGDSVKLWPESMSVLGLAPAERKKWKDLLKVKSFGGNCLSSPRPLTHLFLLEEKDGTPRLRAEKVTAAKAHMTLVENAYHAGLMFKECPSLFIEYADLASKISIYRLNYPRTPQALPHVKSFIEQISHSDRDTGAGVIEKSI